MPGRLFARILARILLNRRALADGFVRAMPAREAVTIKYVGEASQDYGANLIGLCRGWLKDGMSLSNNAG